MRKLDFVPMRIFCFLVLLELRRVATSTIAEAKGDLEPGIFDEPESSLNKITEAGGANRARSLDLEVTGNFQPKVWRIGNGKATRVNGASLSDADGTPWCGGRPTYWYVCPTTLSRLQVRKIT